MSLVRFVHTADLHLDRPLNGMSEANSQVAAAVLDATFDTFQRIIDFTIAQEADALLIAGDVYDGAERSLRAQLRFIEGLEQLDRAGIRSFICHGAADPLDDWTSRLRYPPLAHRFSPEVQAVPLGSGVEVIGVSQPHRASGPDIIRSFSDVGGEGVAIGLLHVDAATSFEPFVDSGIDYLALGHSHARRVVQERGPAIVYPGCPQGFQPDQTGPHGVYLVDIEERDNFSLQFQALDAIRRATIQVDESDFDTEAALFELLSDRINRQLEEAAGRPVIYQIVFSDAGQLDAILSDRRGLVAMIARLNDEFGERQVFAWGNRALVKPDALVDRDRRGQAGDVVAALMRLSDEIQRRPDARDRIRAELFPMLEDKHFAPYRDAAGISSEELVEVVADAEAWTLAALGARP